MAALCLLVLVLAVRLGGVRTGTGLRLVLVAVLVALVVVAVAGAVPGARAAHWTPFAPDGWAGVARAASPLMLALAGWTALVAAGVAVAAGTRGHPDLSARVRSRAPESRHNPEAGRSEPVGPGHASDVCGQSVTGP
ncbi:hypothetical protein [Streptomyces albidoflavus]|uniref:hypothetical protein n=1 Tax=Streptomyces albidoflavus TaxID=1886 RepID=UPI001E3D2963|nr:hypothetical protein [Streptomyces albidoflavus]